MKHIKAIVFDFDGLILDTETTDYKAWQAMYRAYGVELPLSMWLPIIGDATQDFSIDQHLAELVGKPINRVELRKRQRALHLEMLKDAVPMPGVEDYIHTAKRLGIRIGVASGSRRSWVVDRLNRLGLADHFETVVCRDDVGGKAKPDPAAYLAAVEHLGTRADQSIALEDSPPGVKAAKSAGLFCVAVPGPMTKNHSFHEADMQLDSLADIPVQELLESISKA
ncbi:MAG: HAD-IA family hydrolase [Chloroflexi bacterium]|nr:HAD-IA family hydrolase [Chloroflexota bacterium]MYF79993.1 HAD-IA family hydrolase [Chloroflexota bacterium]MYK61422.1 HAD-IA family hydrolase [Chloroflexota bacterium]